MSTARTQAHGQGRAKRAFDLVAGTALATLLSPVILVVAVLVRVRLGSPVIYRQVRPGLGGRPFTIYKFRTMVETDRRERPAAAERRAHAAVRPAPSGPQPRRAARALERRQGRHEPRRPAAADDRDYLPRYSRRAGAPPRGPARDHRARAGQRPERDLLGGEVRPRRPVRRACTTSGWTSGSSPGPSAPSCPGAGIRYGEGVDMPEFLGTRRVRVRPPEVGRRDARRSRCRRPTGTGPSATTRSRTLHEAFEAQVAQDARRDRDPLPRRRRSPIDELNAPRRRARRASSRSSGRARGRSPRCAWSARWRWSSRSTGS